MTHVKHETPTASYDVVVVGGGHAGVEAAAAAARLGARTAMVTLGRANLGMMSCNPAIGGLGKGQLVREIDALDGIMGKAADRAGIQFRMLNMRKGPAVRGPRTQADRRLYAAAVQLMVSEQGNLDVLEDECVDLRIESGILTGVLLAKRGWIHCAAAVITTGTFLRGVIHIGAENFPAGRFGEQATSRLSLAFHHLGLKLGRLKTGTPPRLLRNSIDWEGLEKQAPDASPIPFSLMTDRIEVPQIDCAITRTTPATHDLIRENLHLSALYGGSISSTGPRYCPSVEDKIVRFGDRNGHQIFLEPEGLDSELVYPNGISTSLPAPVQRELVHSIPGLNRAEIVRPGYAIEYDHVDPRELELSLQVRKCCGLFLAGQINGTTGYEEAAAQGVIAGLNAARIAGDMKPVVLSRSEAYIGVMIDDLTTRGVSEPYRMFTSRAEFRLSIRADNADERLTPLGIEQGLIGQQRVTRYQERSSVIGALRAQLHALSLSASEAARRGLPVNQDGRKRTAFDMLSYPSIGMAELSSVWSIFNEVPSWARDAVETEAKYAVYLDRQIEDAERLKLNEQLPIPLDMTITDLPGLSAELRHKLSAAVPCSFAQASRIEGMTPAALSLILAHLRSRTIVAR